jgi:hypothetical protein
MATSRTRPATRGPWTATGSGPQKRRAQALPSVIQIKATLREIDPPVWRRVLVPDRASLADLSGVLQVAFGWLGHHLHEFRFGEAIYGLPDDEAPAHQKDEARTALSDLAHEGMSARYAYDFGDGWEHDLLIEAIQPLDPEVTYPLCTGGARACPPDDCGGPARYADLLRILADPDDPEHAEQRRWVGGFFDPEGFDANRVNRELRDQR